MTTVMAFDPGQTGAFAVLHDGDLVYVADLPVVDKRINAPLLANELDIYQPDQIVVERLHAMPINGSKANFSQGRSTGIIEGVCWAWPLAFVTPSAWKKTHGIRGDRKTQKEAGRRLCIERWPDHAARFARVKDADRADAALIGLHWTLEQ